MQTITRVGWAEVCPEPVDSQLVNELNALRQHLAGDTNVHPDRRPESRAINKPYFDGKPEPYVTFRNSEFLQRFLKATRRAQGYFIERVIHMMQTYGLGYLEIDFHWSREGKRLLTVEYTTLDMSSIEFNVR